MYSRETPVDYSVALRWVDGDRALLAELVEVFVQDCPQRIAGLEEAVKRGQADLIRRAAHSLKGMVSVFGADRAKSLSQRMEELGQNGLVVEAVALLPAMIHEFSNVMEYLKLTDWQTVC